MLLIIDHDVRDAELSIAMRLHRLVMLVLHLRLFVDFLAVQLPLGLRGGRAVSHLGVVLGPWVLHLLLHIWVHAHVLPVVFSLTTRIVIAYVVDMLLANGLHVELPFLLRSHSSIRVFMSLS